MKLEFLYSPTRDLNAALALYRDELGWKEAWREGETTVALTMPDTEVQLMLDASDPDAPFGPIFIVPSVLEFHAKRPSGFQATSEPNEIPGGFMATYTDPSGHMIYVMDQSTDAGVSE